MEVMIFFTLWPEDNTNSLDPGVSYSLGCGGGGGGMWGGGVS